jgi:hypothetical protein
VGGRNARGAGRGRWTPGLAWLLWALTMLCLVVRLWLDHLLRRAGRPELTIPGYELLFVAAVVGMATVGAVLASRRPRHPVGWLMLTLGLTVTIDLLTDGYGRCGCGDKDQPMLRPGPPSAGCPGWIDQPNDQGRQCIGSPPTNS